MSGCWSLTNKLVGNVINIREATKADLDVLREIGCETYQEHFSDIWSVSGMQDFLNQDFSPYLARQITRIPRLPFMAYSLRRKR